MADKFKKIFENPRYTAWISLAASLVLGAVLWLKSDAPPYGWPVNELSDASWGIIVDIAHNWRALQLPLWHGIAGGTSLYTAGFYPILHPLNFLAWFLNDDQFFLFNLVGPYAMGFFFGCLLLREIFALRWPVVFFGALYYMGLAVGRFFLLANGPYYLWGCALLPAMMYAFYRYKDRNILFASTVVGVILAWQFSAVGLMHFLPLVVWWSLVLAVEIFWGKFSPKEFQGAAWRWAVCLATLLFMNAGLWGGQFFPTALFAAEESARIPWYYPINNFPLLVLHPPTEGGFNPGLALLKLLYNAFINSVGVSMRGISALILICLALWAANRKKFFHIEKISLIGKLWIAAAAYCLLTTVIDLFVKFLPFLKPYFTFMTRFTLGYGIHTLDLCIAVTLAAVINNRSLVINGAGSQRGKVIAWIAAAAAAAFIALPIMTSYPPLKQHLLEQREFLRIFVPERFKSALLVFGMMLVIGLELLFRPKDKRIAAAAAVFLVVLGFMTTVTSYNWNNKGRRFMFERYLWDSPEHQYYRAAKGKYYVAYDEPEFAAGNTALLYGVRTISSYGPVPPYRIRRYMAGERFYTVKYWSGNGTELNERPLSETVSYFPVDFTTIKKGESLPWNGFHKEVSGDVYDVWVSNAPPEKLRFADRLKVLPDRAVIESLDKVSFEQQKGVILVTETDALKYGLKEESLGAGAPEVSDYHRAREDRIHFKISSPRETFVILPDMFQEGWKVKINGAEAADPFPAYYLFIGFKVPAGESLVEMQCVPPGMKRGVVLTLFSLWVLWALIKHRKNKIPL